MNKPIAARYSILWMNEDLETQATEELTNAHAIEGEVEWWASLGSDWKVLIDRPDLKAALFPHSHIVISGFDYE